MENKFVDEIMATVGESRQFLTVDYIAKKLELSPRTIRRYIEAGKLEALCFKTSSKRSIYRISRQAFRRFLELFYTMRDCI